MSVLDDTGKDPYILIKSDGSYNNRPCLYIYIPPTDGISLEEKKNIEDRLAGIFKVFCKGQSTIEDSLNYIFETKSGNETERKILGAAAILSGILMFNPDQEVLVKPSEVFRRGV